MTMLLEESAITSKHLKGSAELLLMIPIKPGFVDVPQTVSYATRLKALLAAFFAFRTRSADITLENTPQPIELLEIIYAAQWTVLEEERMLLVAVTFDRSWEEYFARLELITGFLLDALFMHCIGYDKHTSQDGFASFTSWIRSHQRPTDFLFHSSPDLTTFDIRSLRALAQKMGNDGLTATSVNLVSYLEGHRLADVMGEAEKAPDAGIPSDDDLRTALVSLYELRSLFPSTELIQQRNLAQRSAELIFDQAIASLLDPVFRLLEVKAQTPDPTPALTQYLAGLLPGLEDVLKWAGSVYGIARAARTSAIKVKPPKLDAECIQANILRGIPEQRYGAVVLMQCHGEKGLAKLLDNQGKNIRWDAGGDWDSVDLFCNLAITYGGLARARLSVSALEQFPKEFREGMEQRAALLGDIGEPNHPYFWKRPLAENDNAREVSLSAVDVVLIYQAQDRAKIDAAIGDLRGAGDTHYSIVHVQKLERSADGLDAFGLREGASQPKPHLWLGQKELHASADAIDRVPLGELLLGHEDRQGHVAACTQDGASSSLFMNGTFLVMRKLEQDVAQLDMLLQQNQSIDKDSPKSRLVGRDVSELNRSNGSELSNDFDHRDDPGGKRCPLQSHVRLSNPRSGGKTNALSTPRIARRGFSYDDGDAGRGLMFMAYNASITSQYETIQRWLNAGNITGLFSWQNDFLTGPVPALPFPHAYGHVGISLPHGGRSGPCVKLRWGLYLFVPSKKGIEWLSQHKPEPAPDARGGHELIERLQTLALSHPAEAVQEWKRFIEDPAYDRQARAIWAAVRDNNGELDTPYGRLVATEAGAQSVLQDDGSRFSVREYGDRLTDTLAPHYLGMDTFAADFAPLAAADKLFHDTLTPQIAKESALRVARSVLAEHTISNSDGRKTLWIEKDFAKKVVRKLAEEWFFGGPPASNDVWFDHLVDVSRYAFQPHPATSLATLLRNQRNTIAWTSFPADGLLGKALQPDYLKDAPDAARKSAILGALIGGAVGFCAPALLQIVSVLDKWIESDEIGWLAERIHKNGSPDEDLMRVLLEALARRPVPPLLYRTDVQDGSRVIVGLGSAYRDAEEQGERKEAATWLFGGRSAQAEGGTSRHGCPARDAALSTVLGVVKALLEQPQIKRENRLVISYKPAKST